MDDEAVRNSIYWWDSEEVVARPPLEGPRRADVCIVGGGYTGLWTALFLKRAETSLDVAVVERSWAGSGASGHNAGFAMTLLDMSLHHLARNHGDEAAASAHRAVARSVREIGETCRERGIEADYELNGFLSVATNEAQLRRVERDVETAARIGVGDDFELLDRESARARIGSPVVIGAARERTSAICDPMKLVRGLARAAEEDGVVIFEDSPVTSVGTGLVRTGRGEVRAEHVVVCANAYQHTLPGFGGRSMPIWSYQAVTRPLSDGERGRVAWPGREGFEDMRNFITVGRPTADGRVHWSGRWAPYYFASGMDESRHMTNRRAFGEMRAAWRQFFPMWADVPFTHMYGGAICITATFLPYVGVSSAGVHYGYGYNGHGVGPAHTVGRALADLVLGRETEHTSLLFVGGREARLPPEPIRWLGSRLTMELLARQDRRMDAGRDPGDMDPLMLRVLNRLS